MKKIKNILLIIMLISGTIRCSVLKNSDKKTFSDFNKKTYKLVSINNENVFYCDNKQKNQCELFFEFSRIRKIDKPIYASRVTLTDGKDKSNIDKIVFGSYLNTEEKDKISFNWLVTYRGHSLYETKLFTLLMECLRAEYTFYTKDNTLTLQNDKHIIKLMLYEND